MQEDNDSPQARTTGTESIVERTAGIDWITYLIDSRRDREAAEELAYMVGEEDMRAGSKRQPWRWQGYEGWRTASIRLGWHGAKVCLQSTGSSADSIVTHMRPLSGRVTRLDVQTTLRLSSTQLGFGMRCIRRSTTARRSPAHSRPCIGRQRDSERLFIGTVGRRTAPRYLRVYDKGVESGTAAPGLLWRLELEAKAGLAEALWQEYRTATDVRAWCFESLEAQWKSSGCSWPCGRSSNQRAALSAPKKGTPPAVSLGAWYRTSVAPTIPRYLAAYSVAELIDVLGIGAYVVPREASHDVP